MSNVMKKAVVPATMLGAKDSIAALREKLKSGEDMYMDKDGTIDVCDDNKSEWDVTSGGKQKTTVPHTVLGAGGTIGQLLSKFDTKKDKEESNTEVVEEAETNSVEMPDSTKEKKKPQLVKNSILG